MLDSVTRLEFGGRSCQAEPARSRATVEVSVGARYWLAALCQIDGRSAEAWLGAAWVGLLYRYLDQDVVTLSTDVTGVLSLLVCELTGRETLSQLAARIRAASDGQHLPDCRLEPVPTGEAAGGVTNVGWRVEAAAPTAARAEETWPADLVLHRDEGDTIALEYCRRHFRADDVTQLARHFGRIIEQALIAPDIPVNDLALLDEAESDRQLCAWRPAAGNAPSSRTMHQEFEARVATDPGRIAARCAEQVLTYSELDARADRMARRLRAEGVRHGEIVALLLERSCTLLVSVLGVLKAGGAFLMIDPSHPAERVAATLSRSTARVVIARGRVEASARNAYRWLDPDQGTDGELPALETATGPDDLAYLVFTSGSTGEPKGVLVRHESLVSRVRWMVQAYELSSSDVSLQKSPLSFDPSICEMFRLLTVGGTVCFLEHGGEKNPEMLVDAIARWGVTIVDLVPSTLTAFLEYVTAYRTEARLRTLRWVLAGAERLHHELVDTFQRTLSVPYGTRLINTWGATETTVDATWFDCSAASAYDQVPVGRPIRSADVYVLSRAGTLMPPGMRGELFVGGDCVAAGYLDSPEFTRERFVQLPLLPGRTLFRTGDFGRWLPDGNLDFLGRADRQLKIRGITVEPSEVEAMLHRHPDVSRAVVHAAATGRGAGELTAYVVPRQARSRVTPEQIRDFLNATLPGHLVPDSVCILDELPLTASEKVDFARLPSPGAHGAGPGKETEPADPLETALATIWGELLGKSPIGSHDHFFRVGGNSLLAIRLIARVRQRLGVSLSIGDVFAHPLLSDLAAVIRAQNANSGDDSPSGLSPGRTHVASHAQRRIWILSQLPDGNAAYDIPLGLEIRGRVDRRLLQNALDAVVRRHEILRTTFRMEGEDLVQVIHPADGVPVMIETYTLDSVDEPDGPRGLLRGERQRPFDLERGPLLRAGLVRIDEARFHLFLTIHHIIADAWSLSLLLEELFASYRRLESDRPVDVTPPELQYKDYAAWHHSLLSGPRGRELRAYWLQRFRDAPPALALPTDLPRPPVKTYNARVHSLAVGPELTQGLEAVGRAADATLFMTLLSVLAVLLSRYTGQDDFVIGTPVAGRTRTEFEAQLGCYVNSLGLRTRVRRDESFLDLLKRVRQDCLDALEHELYPLDLLVADLELPRDPGRSPLFDVMLVLQNAPGLPAGTLISDADVRELEVDPSLGKLDLIVTFTEAGDGLRLQIQYSTDLFTEARIRAMASHLVSLAAAIVSQPDRPVLDYDFLTEPERRRLLSAPGYREASVPRLLHALVEEHAERTPDRVALTFRDRKLTYRQLNELANRLAHCLRTRYALRPNDVVALLLQRSDLAVVAQLAALKAGAGFLAIDRSNPRARVQFILDDSEPRLVIADDPSLWTGLEIPDDRRLLFPDLEHLEGPVSNPGSVNAPHDLAYLIYTSGSTGQPKGVLVEHRNVVSLLRARESPFEFRTSDTWTVFHSFSFDFSVWEIYGALSSGARLVVVPSEWTRDPKRLARLLVEERVTVFSQVPSAFDALARELVTEARDGSPACLRYVIFGGEPVRAKDLALFQEAYPETQVFNGYGITETTIFSSFKRLERDWQRDRENIGGPVSNQYVYVLDEQLRPVPDGVVGEMFIGGDCVTRGYLRRPELTRSRFLPDPYRAGGRLYRSGDLARRASSGGELTFLGRNDDQVKLRGFRIEIEEIRAALLGLPAIQDCAVVPQEDDTGSAILVGYLLASERTDANTIRRALSARLPGYMVPGRFHFVDELPVGPNGKVDRQALVQARVESLPLTVDGGPRDTLELRLLRLWGELLERTGLGADDDFFSAGGHSLKAVQLVGRIRNDLGAEISVGDVFSFPTVAALAARIRECGHRAGTETLIPIEPQPDYPLTPTQRQFWVLHHYGAGGAASPEILELPEALDPDLACEAFADVIDRFEILRTTFLTASGEPRARILPPGCQREAYRFTDLSQAADARGLLQQIYDQDAGEPFDLTVGPLVRFRLIRLSQAQHLLLIRAHHIVWDGWSYDILVRSWKQAYAARSERKGARLATAAIQFKEFVAWQDSHTRGPLGRAELERWAELLRDFRPADFPSREGRDASALQGRQLVLGSEGSPASGLTALCRRSNATLFMGLAALVHLFTYTTTGRTDNVIGCPVTCRLRPEWEEQPGPFLTVVPLRIRLDPETTFEALLAGVREATGRAFEMPLTPTEAIASRLGLPPHTPLFDIGLTLQSEARTMQAGAPSAWIRETDRFVGQTTALWFDVTQASERLIARMIYNEARLPESDARMLASEFERLISAVLSRPNESLRELRRDALPPPQFARGAAVPITIELEL